MTYQWGGKPNMTEYDGGGEGVRGTTDPYKPFFEKFEI